MTSIASSLKPKSQMKFFLITLVYFVHSQISPIVNTLYGPVEGNITAYGRTFTGIPFAEPPIVSLRWQNPIPPKPWSDVLETNQLPPQCPQTCDDGETFYWCSPTTSEDCLYTNVWTPLNVTSDSSLPVLVWIYGGGFTVGYGAGLQKNGTIFANKTNTIVVSMNYRVGAMGFYYNEYLDIMGNFGYLDQVFAIEWVYNNIKAFGGDPNRITIAGESAGAASVILHILNKTSLIKAAIAESTFGGAKMATTGNWNGGSSNRFTKDCGCNVNESKEKQLQCLKAISWENIVKCQGGVQWGPTVNTTMFPTDPIFQFQRGNFKQELSFIIGMNEGEYYFMMSGDDDVSYNALKQRLTANIGPQDTQLVLQFYNCTDKPAGYNFVNETAAIFTDLYVRCPSRNITASQAIYGNRNNVYSYYYHFSHVSSFIPNEPGCNPLCEYASCHTTEIPYVFQDDLSPIGIEFNKDEMELSKQFQLYWSNMVTTFNPNQGGKANIEWPAYSNQKRNILFLDIGDKQRVQIASDQIVCAFWDSLNYNWLFSG